jgi:hypothetical protein
LEWYTHCSELRTTLSLGAEGDVFPEHLGQPIGTKDAFYLLEMSYENLNGNYGKKKKQVASWVLHFALHRISIFTLLYV